ncbi:MAG TPA: DUF2853 family protein [Acidocella sp.]|nr:DUF2853 family protein [Acidocella sp.]
MSTDWAADVKKYDPQADDKVITGIIHYCGIALQHRDSALVSFTDPKELETVKSHFLKKKLELANPEPELDAALAEVAKIMKADHTRNRVTVYYLLAKHFGKIPKFG